MAKTRTHRIRTGLTADREKQHLRSKRAKKDVFGIGRPLTAESNEQISRVMAAAIPEVEEHLKDTRGAARVAEIMRREKFGVTFLVEDRVGNAMRFGLLERGFMFGRMVEGIERRGQNEVSLELPLDGPGWFDREQPRTMVARLGASEGLQELYEEVPIVAALLDISKAGDLVVNTPDNIVLFDYGSNGDKMGLSRGQRMQVRGIMSEQFERAGIDTLALGGLVIGNSNEYPWMAA